MTYQEHIVRDPRICNGQPVVRGTRVLVRVILGYLAHGETIGAILKEFPSLSEENAGGHRLRRHVRRRRSSGPESCSAGRQGRLKLKLDENIAASVAPRLASLGFDTDTVLDEGLRGKDRARTSWSA